MDDRGRKWRGLLRRWIGEMRVLLVIFQEDLTGVAHPVEVAGVEMVPEIRKRAARGLMAVVETLWKINLSRRWCDLGLILENIPYCDFMAL